MMALLALHKDGREFRIASSDHERKIVSGFVVASDWRADRSSYVRCTYDDIQAVRNATFEDWEEFNPERIGE